jgi:hypothetical protein
MKFSLNAAFQLLISNKLVYFYIPSIPESAYIWNPSPLKNRLSN